MSYTVLVADDNLTIQRMASGILTGEGLEVVTVSNGVAAIRKLSVAKPLVIVADVSMPGRDGYEVCDFVKNSPDLSHVSVLLAVSDMEPYDERRGASVRADGTIKKPFDRAELIAAVTKLLPRAEVEESPVESASVTPSREKMEAPIPEASPPATEAPGESIPTPVARAIEPLGSDGPASATTRAESFEIPSVAELVSLTEPAPTGSEPVDEENLASFDGTVWAELARKTEEHDVAPASRERAPEQAALPEPSRELDGTPAAVGELPCAPSPVVAETVAPGTAVMQSLPVTGMPPAAHTEFEESSVGAIPATSPAEQETQERPQVALEPAASAKAAVPQVASEDEQVSAAPPEFFAGEPTHFAPLRDFAVAGLDERTDERQPLTESESESASSQPPPTAPPPESVLAGTPSSALLPADNASAALEEFTQSRAITPTAIPEPELFPATLSRPPQVTATHGPARALDPDLVYSVVQKVVSRMSPPVLPPHVVEEISKKLADEVVAELSQDFLRSFFHD